MNQFGLTDREMNEVLRILADCPLVQRVLIFGSRAKGTFHQGSDIDLAIMNEGMSDGDVKSLMNRFSESSIPLNVDLVDYSKLTHEAFKSHIDRNGKLFFAR